MASALKIRLTGPAAFAKTADRCTDTDPGHGHVVQGHGQFHGAHQPGPGHRHADRDRQGSAKASLHLKCTSVSTNVVTVTDPGPQCSLLDRQITDLQIQATDSDSTQTLTYEASGLPFGLVIYPASGVISGTPTMPEEFLPPVSVTDPTGASGSTTFYWAVAAHSCGE